MARPLRKVAAGGFFHVLNRGNGRMRLFHKTGDFLAFLKVLNEGLQRYPVDLLSYCLMSNHWHLVLRPKTPSALADFMRWVGVTHVRRHHEHFQTRGGGHLYQGRFKSFPIQDDSHFLTVCRYVEANPLRAGMVKKAEGWPHSSLRWWPETSADQRGVGVPPVALAPWPVERPRHWQRVVNEVMPKEDVESLRLSIKRGRPFGDDSWMKRTAKHLALENTLRPPGRPRKHPRAAAEKTFTK